MLRVSQIRERREECQRWTLDSHEDIMSWGAGPDHRDFLMFLCPHSLTLTTSDTREHQSKFITDCLFCGIESQIQNKNGRIGEQRRRLPLLEFLRAGRLEAPQIHVRAFKSRASLSGAVA